MVTFDAPLSVAEEDGITLIGFANASIREELQIRQIGQQVSQIIEQARTPKILISFENIEHLASLALGTLIEVRHKIHEKGGQLRLSNIPPSILEVFQITRLDGLFEIHGDSEEALKSFG